MSVVTERKQQILEAARELLQTKGYAGFSYQDVADRIGVSKPSLHHHFPTKEALGLALIRGYQAMLVEIRTQLTASFESPAQRLRAFMEFGEKEACEKIHQICPAGTMHANYEVFPESLRVATRELSEALHLWVAEMLTEGREAGELSFPGSPEDEAWSLMAALQGARQQARTHGVQVWRSVARQLEKSLFQGS